MVGLRCAVVLLTVSGCRQLFGMLDVAVEGTDAGRDGTVDVLVDTTTDTTTDAAICAAFPLSFGTSHYSVGPVTTFDQAQAMCVSTGGRLAIIESAAENDAIIGFLDAASASDWSWIGLDDRITEGTDVWIDGVPLGAADYRNFNPKIGGAADCYDFSRKTDASRGKWGDWYCTSLVNFVCECDPARPFP